MMRVNKYLAQASGLSRRAADQAIADRRVLINGKPVNLGQTVSPTDRVLLDGVAVTTPQTTTVLAFHKPAGYVVSREGQGNPTIYDVIPIEYEHLKPVGRLDMYSSGLLLLTNDGDLANELTHPSNGKIKVYEVTLSQPLEPLHHQMMVDYGVQLDDGVSKFKQVDRLNDERTKWQITMSEGRNRQIRRTLGALGYGVKRLHRTQFGPYSLAGITKGSYKILPK